MQNKKAYEEILGKKVTEEFDENYSSPSFDTFVGSKSTMEEEAPYDSYYENAHISDVETDSTSLLVSDDRSDLDLNVENLIVLSSIKNNAGNSYNVDIRYSDIIKDAGDIYVKKHYETLIDYKNIINNFQKNASFKSKMYLKNNNKFLLSIEKICQDKDLKISKISKQDQTILCIEKKFPDKCSSRIYSNGKVYSFSCDVANSNMLKVQGLQGRDYLKSNHGMLFPYESPRDVMFHMGTVKFPIDIIFIDDNNMIKKINYNVKPNSIGVFSSSNVKNVLEIPGGYCANNNISPGDYVIVEEYDSKIGSLGSNENYKSALAFDFENFIDTKSISASFKEDGGLIKLSSSACVNLNKISECNPASRKIDLNIKDINTDLLRDSNFEKIIFYYRTLASNENIDLIIKKACDIYNLSNLNYDVIRVPEYFRNKEVHSAIKNKFEIDKVYFLDNDILKNASFTIDDEVKSRAIKVVKKYEKILLKIIKFKKLLDKNKKAYEKVKDNLEVIKSSKGQYKQSVKRLSKHYKNILKDLRECIQDMDSIKDVQTIEEINSVIIISTKNCSDKVKLVFEMIDDLNSLEFFVDFKKKTEDANKIFDDLTLNIKRMREFIYSNILGKTIISE